MPIIFNHLKIALLFLTPFIHMANFILFVFLLQLLMLFTEKILVFII